MRHHWDSPGLPAAAPRRLDGGGQARPHGQRVVDVEHGDVDGVGGDDDPEHVEEDEVDPLVHEVARVEVVVHGQPLRAEGDEAAVELHGCDDDHQDVGARVLLREPVADVAGERAGDEDGEELEADDGLGKGALVMGCT